MVRILKSSLVEKIIEKDKDPIVVYYLNKITKLEDIFRFLENVVYENEYKPFKLTFEIGGIFEIPDKNLSPESDPEFKYEPRLVTVTSHKFANTIPIMIQLIADLDKVKYYIETNLYKHTTYGASNIKLIYVSNVAFTVHRKVKVSGKVDKLPEEFIKSRLLIVDNKDDGLCWYRFLAICLDQL